MGRTGARLKRLETLTEIAGRMLIKQSDVNLGSKKVFEDMLEKLSVVEGLLQSTLSDIAILKRSNFDYKIKLLSSNLDAAQETIIALTARLDKLENTAWRKFCRWIIRKRSTVCGIILLKTEVLWDVKLVDQSRTGRNFMRSLKVLLRKIYLKRRGINNWQRKHF